MASANANEIPPDAEIRLFAIDVIRFYLNTNPSSSRKFNETKISEIGTHFRKFVQKRFTENVENLLDTIDRKALNFDSDISHIKDEIAEATLIAYYKSHEGNYINTRYEYDPGNFLSYCARIALMALYFFDHGIKNAFDYAVDYITSVFPSDEDGKNAIWNSLENAAVSYTSTISEFSGSLKRSESEYTDTVLNQNDKNRNISTYVVESDVSIDTDILINKIESLDISNEDCMNQNVTESSIVYPSVRIDETDVLIPLETSSSGSNTEFELKTDTKITSLLKGGSFPGNNPDESSRYKSRLIKRASPSNLHLPKHDTEVEQLMSGEVSPKLSVPGSNPDESSRYKPRLGKRVSPISLNTQPGTETEQLEQSEGVSPTKKCKRLSPRRQKSFSDLDTEIEPSGEDSPRHEESENRD